MVESLAAKVVTLTESKSKLIQSVIIGTFGATMHSINVLKPGDKETRNILVSYDTPEEFEAPLASKGPYFGATVGRYANRIKEGKFSLNGQDYQLAINNGNNALHGGPTGFSEREWTIFSQPQPNEVTFQYLSQDMEEGFPCALDVRCTYKLEGDSLFVSHFAKILPEDQQRETIVNLTNHSYFNLSGGKDRTILNHTLKLETSHFIDVTPDLIPLSTIPHQTPPHLDFSTARIINTPSTDPTFSFEGQYLHDHCYVLPPSGGQIGTLSFDNLSLSIHTSAPSFHLYTGRWNPWYKETRHGPFSGVAFEPECYIDAVNREEWRELVVLKPGKEYRQETRYLLSAE
ncbi:hypothetical protein FGO68_gene4193 [Halteria grandinella]|uniref:Aldose 1-epimerase n=1 Tax=Halteria grandinella TaxID=5974 RepID=A0A8J8NKS1_HALGN|nr:hypothetical protein FGO68_gene4193 [Halteria grandinella]